MHLLVEQAQLFPAEMQNAPGWQSASSVQVSSGVWQK
jgi:hypothetical protein